MNIKLTVVVPAYNEGLTIYRSAKEIANRVESINGTSLLIVNDGSNDETLSEIKKLESQNSRVEVLDLQKNSGYGAAISEGYRYASRYSTHVLYMDSDLTNSPDDIQRFYDSLSQGNDYVKATRFAHGGGMSNVPLFRKLHSTLGAKLARYLMNKNISDPTNGFRAIKVGLIDYTSITSTGFSSILEELYLISKIKDIKVANVPVILGSRSGDQKKTSFTYGYKTYLAYLKPCVISFYERIKNGRL